MNTSRDLAVADGLTAGMREHLAELIANRVANSHMVPTGIVTVNHAQERGYAFAYAAGV